MTFCHEKLTNCFIIPSVKEKCNIAHSLLISFMFNKRFTDCKTVNFLWNCIFRSSGYIVTIIQCCMNEIQISIPYGINYTLQSLRMFNKPILYVGYTHIILFVRTKIYKYTQEM